MPSSFLHSVLHVSVNAALLSRPLLLFAVIFEESSGDDDDDMDFSVFLSKPLSAAPGGGVQDGTQLLVIDFSQVR